MPRPRPTEEILRFYGGLASNNPATQALPAWFVETLQVCVAPLCDQARSDLGQPIRFAVVATESWVANSQRTLEGDALIVLSQGLILRLKQFLDLALVYDGAKPPICFVHSEPNEQFEDWHDEHPRLLRPILGDYVDSTCFWRDREYTELEIRNLYKKYSKTPLPAVWQITLLSCLHAIAHEASHIIGHHECFLESLTSDNHAIEPAHARVGIECEADAYAANMIVRQLRDQFAAASSDTLDSLYAFWIYGTCAMHCLWDPQRTLLGANTDGTSGTMLYPHPFRRCEIFLHCASASGWNIGHRSSAKAHSVIDELANNMSSIVLELVARGELSPQGAMRFPNLNWHSNNTSWFNSFGVYSVPAASERLTSTWNEIRECLECFLVTHRGICGTEGWSSEG